MTLVFGSRRFFFFADLAGKDTAGLGRQWRKRLVAVFDPQRGKLLLLQFLYNLGGGPNHVDSRRDVLHAEPLDVGRVASLVSSSDKPEYRTNLSLWADQSDSSRRTFAGSGSVDNDSSKRVTSSLESAAQAAATFCRSRRKTVVVSSETRSQSGAKSRIRRRRINLGLHVHVKIRRHAQRRFGDLAVQRTVQPLADAKRLQVTARSDTLPWDVCLAYATST